MGQFCEIQGTGFKGTRVFRAFLPPLSENSSSGNLDSKKLNLLEHDKGNVIKDRHIMEYIYEISAIVQVCQGNVLRGKALSMSEKFKG